MTPLATRWAFGIGIAAATAAIGGLVLYKQVGGRKVSLRGNRLRCSHPMPGAAFTAAFGQRLHPTKQPDGTMKPVERWHNGIDLAPRPRGHRDAARILAPADGQVTVVKYDTRNGHWCRIVHADGWETSYAHLAEAPAARRGQAIRRGELVGIAGETGAVTGVHLHMVVRDVSQGRIERDPAAWLAEGGVSL